MAVGLSDRCRIIPLCNTTFWIDLTPGPEALKIITNTYLQKILPLVNHSFRKP